VIISIRSNRDLARIGTVDLAYQWILQNIPPGASVVVESRALLLPGSFRAKNVPQLRPKPYAQWRDEGVEYLVASSEKYGPVFDEQAGGPQKFPREYAEYMGIFVQSRELVRFTPSEDRPGPELRIFKVVP
jgi:hypothetical protein